MRRPRPEPPSAPPRFACRCGATVRQVALPNSELIWVDEAPVLGGRLIINADRVVGQQSKFERALGFRRHRFSPSCRLVAA